MYYCIIRRLKQSTGVLLSYYGISSTITPTPTHVGSSSLLSSLIGRYQVGVGRGSWAAAVIALFSKEIHSQMWSSIT